MVDGCSSGTVPTTRRESQRKVMRCLPVGFVGCIAPLCNAIPCNSVSAPRKLPRPTSTLSMISSADSLPGNGVTLHFGLGQASVTCAPCRNADTTGIKRCTSAILAQAILESDMRNDILRTFPGGASRRYPAGSDRYLPRESNGVPGDRGGKAAPAAPAGCLTPTSPMAAGSSAPLRGHGRWPGQISCPDHRRGCIPHRARDGRAGYPFPPPSRGYFAAAL